MRFGIRMAVGIFEKSRRLRTARFSLGIRYSSGPVKRGRGERAVRVMRRSLIQFVAHDASRLVRNTSYVFGYGRTKSGVQCRFSLARKGVRGLRFRFAWAVLRTNVRSASLPVHLPACEPGRRSRGGEEEEARREGSFGKSGKRSRRQQVPRAPQPNCALYSDRMSDSRRRYSLKPNA